MPRPKCTAPADAWVLRPPNCPSPPHEYPGNTRDCVHPHRNCVVRRHARELSRRDLADRPRKCTAPLHLHRTPFHRNSPQQRPRRTRRLRPATFRPIRPGCPLFETKLSPIRMMFARIRMVFARRGMKLSRTRMVSSRRRMELARHRMPFTRRRMMFSRQRMVFPRHRMELARLRMVFARHRTGSSRLRMVLSHDRMALARLRTVFARHCHESSRHRMVLA
jgi:hypothetical protein